MYCDNQVPAGITADKKGCNTMVSFTESGNTITMDANIFMNPGLLQMPNHLSSMDIVKLK